MRIIAGKARGLKLKTIESDSTRPTKDMVKEALFSIISQDVPESVFLDLFAGSGAVGIEALSRGASLCYFSDTNKDCIEIIKDNLTKAKFIEFAHVFNIDYQQMLKSLINKEKIDIIYIDPPYNKGLGIEAIKLISSYDLLKRNGIIVLETDEIEQVPDIIDNFEKFKHKKYGRNVLDFFKRRE